MMIRTSSNTNANDGERTRKSSRYLPSQTAFCHTSNSFQPGRHDSFISSPAACALSSLAPQPFLSLCSQSSSLVVLLSKTHHLLSRHLPRSFHSITDRSFRSLLSFIPFLVVCPFFSRSLHPRPDPRTSSVCSDPFLHYSATEASPLFVITQQHQAQNIRHCESDTGHSRQP